MAGETYYQVAVHKRPFDGQYSADSVIVTLSTALALYNALEMVLLVAVIFKRWRGLYFWSLCLCNFGVVCFALGMMLQYFGLCVLWLSEFWLDLGWAFMVICQSLVLYSRLGLILDDPKMLRLVKWMIIVNSIIFVVPTLVLDWGHLFSPDPGFSKAYFYMEHIQMTGFSLQEFIISGIYVWKATVLLKFISKKNTRSIIWQLLVINVLIIGMDTLLVVFQYMRLQLYQETFKVFVYSVKLKLELNILSKLVDLVSTSAAHRSMTLDIIDSSAIEGQAMTAAQQEMSLPRSGNRSGDEAEKGKMECIVSSESPDPRSITPIPDERDEVDPIVHIPSHYSHYSRYSQPRRASDFLYADTLRSLS